MGLGQGRAARGPHARRAPVGLPRGRARGVAPAVGGRGGGRARRAHAEPARRVDLRLHRPALRGLGGGLRGGPLAPRGRARAPPARADRAAGARPAGRGARAARRRERGGLEPCRAAWPRSPAARTSWTGWRGACRADTLTAQLDGVGCALVPRPRGPGPRASSSRAPARASTRGARPRGRAGGAAGLVGARARRPGGARERRDRGRGARARRGAAHGPAAVRVGATWWSASPSGASPPSPS